MSLQVRHAFLMLVRHKSAAHIDRELGFRIASIVDGGYAEEWVHWITPLQIDDIIDLAEHQRERFRAMAHALSPAP